MVIRDLGKLKEILDCPICGRVDQVYLRVDGDEPEETYRVGCSRCEIDSWQRTHLDKATDHWIQLGVTVFSKDK